MRDIVLRAFARPSSSGVIEVILVLSDGGLCIYADYECPNDLSWCG